MIFDAVVIFILLFSCAIAFLRGFIREALLILGLVAGGIAAYAFSPQLLPVITHALGEKASPDYKVFGLVHGNVMARIVTDCAIFFPILIAVSIASYFVSKGVRAMGLGPLDRTMGVVFGLVRGVLLLALLWLPFFTFTEKTERDQWPAVQDSHTRLYIESVSAWMVSVIPGDLLAGIKKDADRAADESKSARQTLQDMDVLRREKGEGKTPPPDQNGDKTITPMPAPTPATPPTPGTGYDEQQRSGMGKLIDKGLNQ